MKTTRILYWVFTALVFVFEGIMPALTFNSDDAKQGISHLGYPDYFRITLTIFKVVGALVLILPFFKGRIKEWTYAGFTFDFVFASISIFAVDGFGGEGFFPLIVLAVLAASYYCYHKLHHTLKTV